MADTTPPGVRALRDFVVDADAEPSPLLMKGRAPFVDLETPPRSSASAAPAADAASSSGGGSSAAPANSPCLLYTSDAADDM
eukprot:4824503-Alexandrium_andersonii.AAC.1